MVSLTGFRTKLDNKIWNGDVARSVTVYGVSSSTKDFYGEVYDTPDAGSSSKAVPYNTFPVSIDMTSFGERADGQTDMAFPYTTSIEIASSVDMDGTTYVVADVEDFQYGGGVVAKIVRLTEQITQQ